MKATDKDIVLSFVKAINDHNVNKIVSLMSDDHIFIDGIGQKVIGKDPMKAGWEAYYKLFPDYMIDVQEITEKGAIFGLFGYAKATYKNQVNKLNTNFWRTPASWKAIVENNKIKLWQVYCDYSELLKIIGKNK